MGRGSGFHPLLPGTVEMMGGPWPTQVVQEATAGGGSFSQHLVGLAAAVISLLSLPGREERKRELGGQLARLHRVPMRK